jgi:hypothetical protein
MRILFSVFLLTALVPVHLTGQEIRDSSFYNPGLLKIQYAKTAGDYELAAAYFEDTAGGRKVQWLGLYYAALCYIQASYKVGPDGAKDELLDKAQPRINNAFKLKPGEPELMVLQAFLYQSRIQVKPEMRGMSYSMKADGNLKKAAAVDDGNPRAWSLMGYNVFHTPAVFGGGPEKALPLFLKAREKYLSFKTSLPFMPRWGEPENQQMITECKKALK